MSFCMYCGSKIEDGDLFCMKCGRKVEEFYDPIEAQREPGSPYEVPASAPIPAPAPEAAPFTAPEPMPAAPVQDGWCPEPVAAPAFDPVNEKPANSAFEQAILEGINLGETTVLQPKIEQPEVESFELRLKKKKSGEEVVFKNTPIVRVGRNLDCDLWLSDSLISGYQARFEWCDGVWYLIDESRNGTTLNGTLLDKEYEYVLKGGDLIDFSTIEQFEFLEAGAEEAPAEEPAVAEEEPEAAPVEEPAVAEEEPEAAPVEEPVAAEEEPEVIEEPVDEPESDNDGFADADALEGLIAAYNKNPDNAAIKELISESIKNCPLYMAVDIQIADGGIISVIPKIDQTEDARNRLTLYSSETQIRRSSEKKVVRLLPEEYMDILSNTGAEAVVNPDGNDQKLIINGLF